MKKKILILSLVIICVCLIIYGLENNGRKQINNQIYEHKIVYSEIIQNEDKEVYLTSFKEFSNFIKAYDDIYFEINDNEVKPIDYFNEDFFKHHNLAIITHKILDSKTSYDIDNIKQENNKGSIHIIKTVKNEYSYGCSSLPTTSLDFISFDKRIGTVNFETKTINKKRPEYQMEDKPIIYLYPNKKQNITVKLGNSKNLTVSYPKYQDYWSVSADINGNLIDLKTNKKLYALYYESLNNVNFTIKKDGFVVKGSDTINFLEEKLKTLGLNEKESEEFIIYWLPRLEKNKYNYIRFATKDEINKNMPLEIKPNPNSIIRILMTFKKLEEPIDIIEQQLKTPQRNGFTVVEWGGTEIK